MGDCPSDSDFGPGGESIRATIVVPSSEKRKDWLSVEIGIGRTVPLLAFDFLELLVSERRDLLRPVPFIQLEQRGLVGSHFAERALLPLLV